MMRNLNNIHDKITKIIDFIEFDENLVIKESETKELLKMLKEIENEIVCIKRDNNRSN